MFKFHNSISISNGESTLITQNAVLGLANALRKKTAYAKFIIIKGGGGAVKKAAHLENINTNIVKGALRAEYSAVFDDSGLTGMSFGEFGLSENGIDFINMASCEPVVKIEGSPITVSITVYVEFVAGTVNCLLGGDNPLAAFLLGYKDLGEAKSCSMNYMLSNQHIEFIDFPKFTDAVTVEVLGNGLRFIAKTNYKNTDVIIGINNVPALRVYLYTNQLDLFTVSANNNTCRVFNPKKTDIQSIASCTYDSLPVVNLESNTFYSFNNITKVDIGLNYKVSRDAVLSNDRHCKNGIIKFGNEFIFLTLKDNVPTLSKRFYDDAEKFELLFNGRLLLYKDNPKMVYAEGGETEYPLKINGACAAVFEGDSTYLAFPSPDNPDSVIKRYSLSPDGTVKALTDCSSAGANVKIFSDLFSLCFIGDSRKVRTSSQHALFLSDSELTGMYTKYGTPDSVDYYETGAVLNFPNQKKLSFYSGANNYIDIPEGGKIKNFKGFFLIKENSKNYIVYLDIINIAVVKIETDIDPDKIISICKVGEYIITINTDGQMETYLCNRVNAGIISPTFSSAKNVTMTLRAREPKTLIDAVIYVDVTAP